VRARRRVRPPAGISPGYTVMAGPFVVLPNLRAAAACWRPCGVAQREGASIVVSGWISGGRLRALKRIAA
jgi:hypothetical protein